MPGGEKSNRVEVIYALPEQQVIVELDFTPGLTAAHAVERSGLLKRFPEITTRELVLGIYGVEVAGQRLLEAGERVEISRPLLTDPRILRRELLAGGRVMGGASALPGKLRSLE